MKKNLQMKTMELLWLLLWFGFSMSAFRAEMRMKSVGEFIGFKDNVYNGTSYSGMTVFLDPDIDFTGKVLERIGTSSKSQFRGVFDGQGHVISNLNMNSSSSQNAGLFGYSEGLTIKKRHPRPFLLHHKRIH